MSNIVFANMLTVANIIFFYHWFYHMFSDHLSGMLPHAFPHLIEDKYISLKGHRLTYVVWNLNLK